MAELGVSERFACRVLGQPRTTQRKVPRTADDEVALTRDIIAHITLVPNSSTGVLEVKVAGISDTLAIPHFTELLSPGFAAASLLGFQFTDGTYWSAAQIINILETNQLSGELNTQGSTLSGPFPNNYVDPGLDGNHDIVSTGGANTYVFGLGYGDDTIHDSSGGGSEVLFNPDVSTSAIQLTRGGANFWDLTITLADGSELDIANEFGYTPYGFGDSIENDIGILQFQDSDGATITYSEWSNPLELIHL